MASLAPASLVPRHIRDADDARAVFGALSNDPLERCGFAFIGPEWRLLGLLQTDGQHVGMAAVPMRQVIADVIRLDAIALVMVHNNPSRDRYSSTITVRH